jgi:SEC-C motif
VRVRPAPKAMESCCYQNVNEKVRLVGGKMQLGWAVWQHENLFVEAEPHAVFDPGNGQPWTDPTPNSFPDGGKCREILFVPNDGTRDPNSTVIEDNIRIPLVDDPRVAEALKLSSKRIALVNKIPKEWTPEGLMYHYPPGALMQIMELESRAGMLLAAATESSTLSKSPHTIARNSSCPCGSGKRYKRCCGKE